MLTKGSKAGIVVLHIMEINDDYLFRRFENIPQVGVDRRTCDRASETLWLAAGTPVDQANIAWRRCVWLFARFATVTSAECRHNGSVRQQHRGSGLAAGPPNQLFIGCP